MKKDHLTPVSVISVCLPTRVWLPAVVMLLCTDPASAERQLLPHHVPAAARNSRSNGRRAPSDRLNLAISLPLRDREGLTNLLANLYNPASPDYRRYLTPEQFAERFGPTEADYQTVASFMRSNGLTVTRRHPNRTLLDVSGTVAEIERTFHVALKVYQHPTESRTFYAPDSEPSLDLAVPVLAVRGLDNYLLPRPALKPSPLPRPAGVTPAIGSGPGGSYMGNDFRAAYAPGVALTGAGQTLGLLEFDGYFTNDITAYENLAGLPAVPLQNVLLDGFDGSAGADNGEVALDIEMAISMAPGLSRVVVYEGGPNGIPDDILNRMATDNVAKQISSSWTWFPFDPAAEQIFQQFAAQGQSFFNASGDTDAFAGAVAKPADDPYITIVGGTTLTTSGPGGVWVSETTWNWGNGYGSGGGISTSYGIPWWQQGIDMSVNQGSATMRNTPDVAMVGDNAWVVYNNGGSGSFGGTSIGAPLWAGLTALVNQQAVAGGKPTAGFVNPAIYALARSSGYATAFHDITTGNNTSSSSPSRFYAVSGYDLCTGWGTPAGSALIDALASPDPLRISPLSGFGSSGPTNGPFSVTSQTFSLTNAGTSALSWTLVNTSIWLSASPTSGTLAPGGGPALVSASLNAAAYALPAGVYTGTIFFTNLNGGLNQGRPFTLRVRQADYFTEVFDASDNDLAFSSITFTPDGSGNFYSACHDPVTAFPTDPTGGTNVPLTDDSFSQITLSGTNKVGLYGTATNVFFIGSNGYLTLNSGDANYVESLTSHFNLPRISALFHDLNPSAGGTISWRQLTNRVVVTYQNVPQYGTSTPNNFQIEWFFDGRIRLTWLTLNCLNNIAGLSAGRGLATNFSESDLSQYGSCTPPLLVTVPPSATEGDGTLAGAGHVLLPAPLGANLTLSLSSSYTNKVVVPTTVTVTAGRTDAAFDLAIVDNAVLDGTQAATITASAPGYRNGTNNLLVYDNETATLQVLLPPTVIEGAGPTQGVVRVSSVVAANVAVNLASSDATVIQVPPTVVIPAGQTSAVFTATIPGDSQIDGPQTASVIAYVQNWTHGSATVTALDNKDLNLRVSLPASATEGDGVLVHAGQAQLSGALPTNLVVSLYSSNLTELSVPATIIIPAGQSSAAFDVTVLHNPSVSGDQIASIGASAPGFVSGWASMVVKDYETPPLPSNPTPTNLAVNVPANTALKWAGATGDATNEVYFGTEPIPGPAEDLGSTTNATWTVPLLAPNTTYYWQIVSRRVGVTAGPVWRFTTRSVDHFAWANIGSSQSQNQPIGVTVTAQDELGRIVTNFTGPVSLTGYTGVQTTNRMLDGSVPAAASTGVFTWGYSFVPTNNMVVTHVRSYFGTKVSVWTATGVLLASQSVVGPDGTWTETELGTPLTLAAGSNYVVAAYVPGTIYYWITNVAGAFPGGTIYLSLYSSLDGFPTATTTGAWPMVGLRYTVGNALPVAITPTNSGTFANGAWTGNMTVQQFASSMYLRADDGLGHTGDSSLFNVIGLHHFSWSGIASPQLQNQPFSVALAAWDQFNNVLSNFAGPVSLAGYTGIQTTNRMLDGSVQAGNSTGTYTWGYTFTPTNNLVVTHVRRYFGTKISVWTATGVLLASQNVVGTDGTWTETALGTPVTLVAGSNYLVAAYVSSGNIYWITNLAGVFPDGTINLSLYSSVDGFPTSSEPGAWPMVGLRYIVGSALPVALTPTNSGTFANGSWAGNMTVQQFANGVYLRADDGQGHRADSTNFTVLAQNDLLLAMTGSPNPAGVGGSWTNTLVVTNTGPASATGVFVTNAVPVGASFASATASQGTFSVSGNLVVFTVGTLNGGTTATFGVVVTPTVAGTLTNVASVARNEIDPTPANNSARTTTLAVPVVSIDDAAVLEGDLGTTNAGFTVRLSAPYLSTVQVSFTTSNGTATAGTDYRATNGVLLFNPGVTTQQVLVPVIGNVQVQPNRSFYVQLSSPTNAVPGRSQAAGTILDDDGIPGKLHHFVWAPVSSPQAAGAAFPVTIMAVDAFGALATNFNATATLRSLAGGPGEVLRVDLESGLQGFNFDNNYGSSNGLWHLSAGRALDPGHSPSHSLYYGHNEGAGGGGNYDNALKNGGAAISPDISLPAGGAPFSLCFNYLMDVENATNWDQAGVEISTNHGASYAAVASKNAFGGLTNTTGGQWISNTITLPALAGPTLRVRFRFDTIDASANSTEGWYVDDIAIRSGTAGSAVALTPFNTGAFTNGVWSGTLAVSNAATDLSLVADDGGGHLGTSSAFNVMLNDVRLALASSPDPATVGSGLTYTISVANNGPALATGVIVTNFLPSQVSFASATCSQGTWVLDGDLVIWNVGTVPGAGAASLAILVTATSAGTVKDVATVTRNELDAIPDNNLAIAATHIVWPSTGTNFASTGLLTIPSLGPASPYPSTNRVSGLAGMVAKLTVTLSNLSHSWPDDISVLLVGPVGQNVMLMNETGGAYGISNVTLTFDDEASLLLPDAGQITSGAFKPTDFNLAETLPGPAPARPFGAALAAFNGTNPNGLWKLFVYDDSIGNSGSIGNGWSLFIITVPLPKLVLRSPAMVSGQFGFSFETVPGYTYAVEYKNALTDLTWLPWQSVPGDGTTKTVAESMGTNPRRFYRVRVQ